MNNLLSSNFSRLFKNKVFWLCMIAMFTSAVLLVISGYRRMVLFEDYEIHYSLDQVYFQFATFIGIICAVFTSFFLGTEYGDGTIRNKIIVGQTRTAIYFANLIINSVASLLFLAVWFFMVTVIGFPLFGELPMGALQFVTYLAVSIFMVLALVSIFTTIGMLSHNKAITVVMSVLSVLALLLIASMIYSRLNEPEQMSGLVIITDGIQLGEDKFVTSPNPAYVSGTLRKVLEFFIAFLPTGQALCLSELQDFNYVLGILSSIFITIVTTLGGMALFQKKDIK